MWYKMKNKPELLNIIMGSRMTGKSAYLKALNAAQESGQRMGYAKGRDETAREILQELKDNFVASYLLPTGLDLPAKTVRYAKITEDEIDELAKKYGIELE